MKTNVSSFRLTNHAKRRIAQRSIHEDALCLVLVFGTSLPAGDGCKILKLDRSVAKELLADGVNEDEVTAAQKTAAILSSDGALVTTYYCSDQAIKKYKHAA